MANTIIKFITILLIFVLFVVLFVTCKKILYLYKYNIKGLSCRIIQPDKKMILQYVLQLFISILINVRLYQRIYYHPAYDDIGTNLKIIVLINILLILSVLAICNELIPTIVSSEYICWRCKKVYQKEEVSYYYDNEKIHIHCDTNKLIIKRRTKYNSLLKILDTYYKIQEY